jgi:RNA polymerase sigma-70 factor (sigma-E family)
MRADDEQDFTEFVSVSSARLFRTAYAVCGDHQLAEDAVQSALVSAYRSWPRVRATDSPEAYVRRIVINQLFSWRRRRAARGEVLRGSVPERPAAQSPQDRVVESDHVWQMLRTLSPRQRAVVVLRYVEDLSEEETARALGIRPGTVKSQASTAFAHLRRRLEHGYVTAKGDPL